MSRRLNRVCVTAVARIAVVFLGSVLAGCGGGGPSDSNIHDAVQKYCEQGSNIAWSGGDSLKLPASPDLSGLLEHGSKIRISEVRVVKRGKPFHEEGENSVKRFPVRVYVKGMKIQAYGKMKSDGTVVHAKDINLPFEGETDLVIEFKPPDKSQVDSGPGKWIAEPH
jgi:hypothetical protein